MLATKTEWNMIAHEENENEFGDRLYRAKSLYKN